MAKLSPTLSHLNADRVYKIILKGFVKPNIVPKELAAVLPTLEPHFHLLEFKGIDKKKILKALKTVKNVDMLDEMIYNFFNFHRVVVPEQFLFCEKALMSISSRLPPPCLECLFSFGFRLFIHTLYLLQEDIDKVMNGYRYASQSSVLSKYSVVLFYLAKFEGEYRLKFHDVLPKFLSVFGSKWRDVFRSKNSQLQRDFLNIFICFVPVVQGEKQEKRDFSLIWLVDQLGVLVSLIEAGTYTFNVEHSFRSILTGFLALVTMAERQQRIQIGTIVTRAVGHISLYASLPNECLLVGQLALNLFLECFRFMSPEAIENQLRAVLDYAAWIITEFPELERQSVIEEVKEYELGKIGLETYFSKAETIADIPDLPSNKQLAQVIDHIVTLCKGSTEQGRLMDIIIDSVPDKGSKLTEPQMRGYLVFVLETVRKVDEELLFTSFDKKWSFLVSEAVFPSDMSLPVNRKLQALVSVVLLRAFLYQPGSRVELLNLLYKLSVRQKRLVIVMPILNSLLTSDHSSDFHDTLVCSPVFPALVMEAEKNVQIFDFIRNIAFAQPEKCWKSETLGNFFAHNYWNELYRDSILQCISSALRTCGQSAQNERIIKSVLTTIAIILTTGYSKHTVECNSLMEVFAECVGSFCPAAVDACLENAVLDMVARYFVTYEDKETLKVAMKVLRSVEFVNWRTKQLFNWPKFSVNSILSSVVVHESGDMGSYLREFASDWRGCLNNENGLKLLLKWSAGKRSEKKILEDLFARCSVDASNIFHLQRAGAVQLILERLMSVDDDGIATALCDLLYLVSRETFSASGMYRLIELLRIPGMKWTKKLVEIVTRLLKPVKNRQASFFYLDGCHTGLFTSPIDFNKKLVFVFECRFTNTTTESFQPVLTFPVKHGYILFVGLMSRHMIVRTKEKVLGAFKSSFVNDLIYDINVILCENSVQLVVNTKTDEETIEIPQIESTKLVLSFGAKRKNDRHGLIAHVSHVSIYSEYYGSDKGKDVKNAKELLCSYHPVNANEDFCVGSGICGRKVEFRGIPIHNCLTFEKVVPNFHFLVNFIPLLNRLQNQDEWPSIDEGVMFFNLVLSLITNSLNDNGVQSRFSAIKGMRLLGGYLMRVDPEFFRESSFQILIKLFQEVNMDLQKEMITSVWLNFDLIHRLNPRLQKSLLSEWAYSLFDAGASRIIENYDFLLYYLMVYYSDESENSLLAWKLAVTLLRKNLSLSTAGSLLALPIAIDSGNILLLAITMISELLKENSESVIKTIQEYDYLVPFVVLLSKNSAIVQVKSLECIDYIVSHWQLGPDALDGAVCQAVVICQESDNVESLANYLTELLCGGKWSYFPLFCHVIRLVSKDVAIVCCSDVVKSMLSSSSKFISSSNNTWPIWMLMFTSTLYKCRADPRNVASIIAMLISKDANRTEEGMLEWFAHYIQAYSVETKNDMMPLYREILMFVLRDSPNKAGIPGYLERIFKSAFEYIFYQPKIAVGKARRRPKYLENLQFLEDQFCWFKNEICIEYSFALRMSDTGWADEDMANLLIGLLVDDIPVFRFSLADRCSISSLELLAYLFHIHMRFGKCAKASYVKKLVKAFPQFRSEEVHNAAYILSLTFGVNLTRHSCFDDAADSPELTLFLFENTLLETGPILSIEKDRTRAKVCDAIITLLEQKLDLTDEIRPIEKKNPRLLDQFFSAMKSTSFTALNQTFNSFETCQMEKQKWFLNEANTLIDSFMQELKRGAGPWSEIGEEIPMRLSSHVSKSGRRVLMLPQQANDFMITVPNLIGEPRISVKVTRRKVKNDAIGELKLIGKVLVFEQTKRDQLYQIQMPLSRIEFIFTRSHGREDNSIEVFLKSSRSYLFIVHNNMRSKLLQVIDSEKEVSTPASQNNNFQFFEKLRKQENGLVQKHDGMTLVEKLGLSLAWKERQISTFSYIYYLNLLAGRSVHDTSQYLVFPWILSDYVSDSLDLSNPDSYRDFEKPIGAISEVALAKLKENLRNMDNPSERCLFRTLYSNEIILCGFLVRVEPFATLHRSIQGGTFDIGARLFSSIPDQWNSIMDGTGDCRELIPEFFCCRYFLTNENHFDLGTDDDVKLPPWAKSPADFIQRNMEALESEYVSEHIPTWFDLIFGCCRNSIEHSSLYSPIFYPETTPCDPESALLMQKHAVSFGLCARQLFTTPHVQRDPLPARLPMLEPIPHEHNIFRIRKSMILYNNMNVRTLAGQRGVIPGSYSLGAMCEMSKPLGLVVIGSALSYCVSVWDARNYVIGTVHHGSAMICALAIVGGRTLITSASDCSLRRISLPLLTVDKMTFRHSDPAVAIAGNSELNVLVSVDAQDIVVFETITDGKLIKTAKLQPFGDPTRTKIAVYKSGYVCFIQTDIDKSRVTVMDTAGKIMAVRDFPLPVIEFDKYTDNAKEMLVLGLGMATVEVLDVLLLESVKTIQGVFPRMRFCVVKERKSILIATTKDIAMISLID